jgi:hypothetical protein
MRSDDLAAMSDGVRSAARVEPNGEVLWPFDAAVAAVNELAALGRVVPGVDARMTDEAGRVAEIPISDFMSSGTADDVDRARDEALAAIARTEAITGWTRPYLLVTW